MTAIRDYPCPAGPIAIDHESGFVRSHAARAHRAFLIGELVGAALVVAAAFVDRTRRRLSERRRARVARAMLVRLADPTLRDVGFHRSEFFRSDLLVTPGETADEAEPARVRAAIARYPIPN
jgi:hypothetical protein